MYIAFTIQQWTFTDRVHIYIYMIVRAAFGLLNRTGSSSIGWVPTWAPIRVPCSEWNYEAAHTIIYLLSLLWLLRIDHGLTLSHDNDGLSQFVHVATHHPRQSDVIVTYWCVLITLSCQSIFISYICMGITCAYFIHCYTLVVCTESTYNSNTYITACLLGWVHTKISLSDIPLSVPVHEYCKTY